MVEQGMSLCSILQQMPQAMARVRGSQAYPDIRGKVEFYQTDLGVIVVAGIDGLPAGAAECNNPVFGFHIHEGNKCQGNAEDSFAEVGQHYNPDNCPHPNHAGDLPPLFGNEGYALQVCLTNRFSVEEIIGKTIIVHSASDDFTSQPSGNAGEKVACGEIKPRLY